jgi:hypothetical protein
MVAAGLANYYHAASWATSVSLSWMKILSFWLFGIGAVFGAVRGVKALPVICFLLPFTPALDHQLQALFDLRLNTLTHPGLDLAFGFLLGGGVRALARRDVRTGWDLPLPVWFGCAYLPVTVALAIGRNLRQSASTFSVKGFGYNVSLLRWIGWHEDYMPLRDWWALSLAFFIFLAARRYARRGGSDAGTAVLAPLFLSGICLSVFALAQRLFGIGWEKMALGVNSFFPDLHSFAGFSLMIACGAPILWRAARERQMPWLRWVCGIASVASLASLYVSQSRFSLMILPIAYAVFLALALRKHPRRWQLLAGTSAAGLILAVAAVSSGYVRGLDWAHLSDSLSHPNLATLNSLLSRRPEIFLFACKLIRQFPLLGVGQGLFNRVSADPAYSTSSYLLGMKGDHAHNYFLQTVAETGAIGGALYAAFLLLPLLEREMLVLAAVLTGLLYGRLPAAEDAMATPKKRWLFAGSLVVALLAVHEVISTRNDPPFDYGHLCFQDQSWSGDRWISGRVRLPVPSTIAGVEFNLTPGQQDVGRRPITAIFRLVDADHGTVAEQQRVYTANAADLVRLPTVQDGRRAAFYEIQVDHCYVPRNLGVADDPRRLGLNLRDVNWVLK